jgi:beta-phosphoglucomutase
MNVKAIVFDMDGVLFHSSQAHASAFQNVLRKMGIKRFDYRLVAGMKTPEAMQRILRAEGKKVSEHEIRVLSRKKQALAYRLLARNPPVAKGCRPLLEKLSQRYRLALVSSSRRKNVTLFLKASGAKRFFSLVMAGEDLPRSKPSPLLYKTVLRRLKVKAKEILVVEDSLQGIRAAARAHLRVVGVQRRGSGRRLRQAGAFQVIHDIRELGAL